MPRSGSERADIIPRLAEVFRQHGYEGASLALISAATGLGKGSLYHFFPGGKEDMANAVLAHIADWFERHLYAPLRTDTDARAAIHAMFQAVDAYFRSGQRICIVGAFALGDARDLFAVVIETYFVAWRQALADALRRAGKTNRGAEELAEFVVIGIQGALVGARAFHDAALFGRTLRRLERQLDLDLFT